MNHPFIGSDSFTPKLQLKDVYLPFAGLVSSSYFLVQIDFAKKCPLERMAVESEMQDTVNKDSNGGGEFEVTYEDYRDWSTGASYEDYGVIPEGYDESFEDAFESNSTHTALLEDQHRTKDFAKHAWIKVVREVNGTASEEGGEPQNEDSSTGGAKVGKKNMEEKKEGDDSGFSEKKEKRGRRKNYVETRWPLASEREEEDDSDSADMAERVLLSLINN